jgi:hypothetical protein
MQADLVLPVGGTVRCEGGSAQDLLSRRPACFTDQLVLRMERSDQDGPTSTIDTAQTNTLMAGLKSRWA